MIIELRLEKRGTRLIFFNSRLFLLMEPTKFYDFIVYLILTVFYDFWGSFSNCMTFTGIHDCVYNCTPWIIYYCSIHITFGNWVDLYIRKLKRTKPVSCFPDVTALAYILSTPRITRITFTKLTSWHSTWDQAPPISASDYCIFNRSYRWNFERWYTYFIGNLFKLLTSVLRLFTAHFTRAHSIQRYFLYNKFKTTASRTYCGTILAIEFQ